MPAPVAGMIILPDIYRSRVKKYCNEVTIFPFHEYKSHTVLEGTTKNPENVKAQNGNSFIAGNLFYFFI